MSITRTLAAVWATAWIAATGGSLPPSEALGPAAHQTIGSSGTDPAAPKGSSSDWLWMGPWRERGDCGPLALFVLMKLQGEQVTVEDIKRLTPFDPKQGCSLEDLSRTAGELGMRTEVKFVNPRELGNVPRPFILHGVTSLEKGIGHFAVIVDHDPQKGHYALIDPIGEAFRWNPEESVLYGYSGYVLVPVSPVGQRWDRWAAYTVLFVGAVILFAWSYRVLRRGRGVAD